MKIFTPLTILFFCIALQSSSFGQLSGYYTIGGATASYFTLGEAMTDLNAQGISDNVIFALLPGTYDGVSFGAISGASANHTFEMRSSTLDSTDVIFTNSVSFHQCSFITLRSVTISTSYSRSIDFIESENIYINNCIIHSSNTTQSYYGAVNIQHFWQNQGSLSSITLSNCSITSPMWCIYNRNEYGSLTMYNCNVNSSGSLALKADYANRIKLYNSNFLGGLDFDLYHTLVLKGNYVTGEIDFGLADSIIDNTFENNSELRISSKYFKGNNFLSPYFTTSGIVTTGNVKYIDNYFEGDIMIGHAPIINMSGNTFLKDVFLAFNHVLHFEKNIIYGDLNYGDSYTGWWDYQLQNNVFIGGCLVGRGYHSNINYNNFLDGAYLWKEYSDIQVHDNNFCSGVEHDKSNISHNNYYPLIYCFYDTNSVSYDPLYDICKPGYATNPILQGKGWTEAPEFDLLGNKRKNPTAIGANEIFICSDSLNNILTIPCGEELYLNMCSLPATGTNWWTPDICIANPDSAYTAVTACGNMTWYLNNSVYGIVDSVRIQTEPFQVEIAEDLPTLWCGWAVTLNSTYHPNATYHWTPETGLSDPFIRNPMLTFVDPANLEYVVECNVPGCGVSYDTTNINYNPNPYVNMYFPEQKLDTVFFTSSSTCVDTYFWDFGDGNYSTMENPMHIYQQPGYYTVFHRGTNAYGNDSVSYTFAFFWVSLPEYLLNANIQIFPNPAVEEVTVKGLPPGTFTDLSVFNLGGEKLLNANTNMSEYKIDLRNLTNGIYLLRISNNKQESTKKIAVIH
jgi:hypothetical protein